MLRDIHDQIDGIQASKYKKLLRFDKYDHHVANTIVATHLPFIADLMNHDRAKFSTPPPVSIIHIIQWLLAFAQCVQRHRNLESLMTSLPRNRSSTAKLLESQDFINGISTNRPEILLGQISELTQTPLFRLQKGRLSSRDIVPQTEYLSPEEWDAMVTKAEEERERLAEDMARAKRELERMVVDEAGNPTLELA